MDWKVRASVAILWLSLLMCTIQFGEAEKKIVCYYTNWSVYRPGTAKFSPQNINPYLCTHLIYAFGGFTKDNALKPFDKYQDIEKGGYAKFTGLKTYNKNLKTMLAIGGWNEGSSRFSPMVADEDRRKQFVKNSVKFLRQNHFDGLDLDWEYPAFRDGGKPRDKDNYAHLVQELREEFERESSKTGRPRLLLSMAMPAGIEYIDKGYDVERLNEYLDFINLLSYDYHSAFEPAVNHHAPLYPIEEDNEYNYDTELTIDYTIKHLLEKGASSEKIVLGIPTYGRSYTLFNEDSYDLGSPADGPGEEGDATREKGYLAYYEICENIAKSDDWEVVQPNPKAMGPYAFKGNQWVGYDDEDIVRKKSIYVNEKKLGGIMFWSIDNDDFRGKCHGRPYPLIEAAKEAMLTGNDQPTTDQKPKSVDNRKKSRISGENSNNSINRRYSSPRRSTTTAAPTRKRVSSLRPKSRSNARDSNEEEEETAKAASRVIEEHVEEDEDVGSREKKGKSKPRFRNRENRRGHRKNRQREKSVEANNEESRSNQLTTPEPPTTPDPGSDFKCEDEGFFSHPRDCKKYFWCLDSGPGGLGVVAHQFTCPSGLVFNKAADSCDYPRNVICPKAKKASTTTTTSKPSTTRRTTTTSAPDSSEEEEYEYYDEDEDDEEEAGPVRETKTSTTAKPLLYKTISRRPPSSTTTKGTTTTTTLKPPRFPTTTTEKAEKSSFVDEEDPRVIKELIDLIKKAGGIEQLEKQLLLQEKSSGNSADSSSDQVTPATISRSLYERVLSRQANRAAGGLFQTTTTVRSTERNSKEEVEKSTRRSTSFRNGPGASQFEGLDEVPEVKSLRRTYKPQYVTIARQRPQTEETPVEEVDESEINESIDDAEDDEDDQNAHSPSETSVRVTPSYVNIRRSRPTSRSENDVDTKETEEAELDKEPNTSKNFVEGNPHRESTRLDEVTTTAKSRYVNIHRFRSTTGKPSTELAGAREATSIRSVSTIRQETESPTVSATTPLSTSSVEPIATDVKSTSRLPEATTEPSITTRSTAATATTTASTTPAATTTTGSTTSTSENVRLVEETATEILLTTVPASASSTSAAAASATPFSSSSVETYTKGASIGTVATVLQPRPFGFARRTKPTASTTVEFTSTVAPAISSTAKPKVENSSLPTLKELISQTTLSPDNHFGYNFDLSTSVLNYRERNFTNDIETRENDLTRFNPQRDSTIDDIAENSFDYDLPRRRKETDDEFPIITTIRPTTVRRNFLLTASSVTRGFYVTQPSEDTTVSTIVPLATSIQDFKEENGVPSTESTTRVDEVDSSTSTNEIQIELEDKSRVNGSSSTRKSANSSEIRSVDNAKEDRPSGAAFLRGSVLRRKIVKGRARSSESTTMQSSIESDRQSLFARENSRKRTKTRTRTGNTRRGLLRTSTEKSREIVVEESGSKGEATFPFRKPGPFARPTGGTNRGKINTVATQRQSIIGSLRRNRPESTSPPKIVTVAIIEDAAESNDGTRKRVQADDQSSRAQELTVALVEPPTSESPSTGGSKFRTTIRRRISTTLAPRTSEAPASGRNAIARTRQGSKAKPAAVEYVPSRPRRPQVIDYDYYEDDEERLVNGKSVLDGKLFITKKGSIKCLDQGNFPHPSSCKKFITCARMVNGQVFGNEYTCPDKLSFDPVGGICNWSAGLGCQE